MVYVTDAHRLQGADPTLGVEMMSTGEVACFGEDLHQAFLKALLSSGFKIPPKGGSILLSVGREEGKLAMVESCATLQRLGYTVFATPGTATFFQEHGVAVSTAYKHSDERSPNVKDLIADKKVDLVINDPMEGDTEDETDGYLLRRATVDFGISLVTNIKCAQLLVAAMAKHTTFSIVSMEEYYLLDGEHGEK